jgi:hypothetical protein
VKGACLKIKATSFEVQHAYNTYYDNAWCETREMKIKDMPNLEGSRALKCEGKDDWASYGRDLVVVRIKGRGTAGKTLEKYRANNARKLGIQKRRHQIIPGSPRFLGSVKRRVVKMT